MPSGRPIGRAQGGLAIPAGKELRLNVNPQASTDLSPFRAIPAHAIQYLQLSASRVNNDSLAHLAHLTGLRVLWLYDTRISDAGLVHLQSLRAGCGCLICAARWLVAAA